MLLDEKLFYGFSFYFLIVSLRSIDNLLSEYSVSQLKELVSIYLCIIVYFDIT